jgi:hypothetical protein
LPSQLPHFIQEERVRDRRVDAQKVHEPELRNRIG